MWEKWGWQMHNFSELSDTNHTTSFIPVCIKLYFTFGYIVSLKYGRSSTVQHDNEANQVTANSLMQNQGATYNTLLIHLND